MENVESSSDAYCDEIVESLEKLNPEQRKNMRLYLIEVLGLAGKPPRYRYQADKKIVESVFKDNGALKDAVVKMRAAVCAEIPDIDAADPTTYSIPSPPETKGVTWHGQIVNFPAQIEEMGDKQKTSTERFEITQDVSKKLLNRAIYAAAIYASCEDIQEKRAVQKRVDNASIRFRNYICADRNKMDMPIDAYERRMLMDDLMHVFYSKEDLNDERFGEASIVKTQMEEVDNVKNAIAIMRERNINVVKTEDESQELARSTVDKKVDGPAESVDITGMTPWYNFGGWSGTSSSENLTQQYKPFKTDEWKVLTPETIPKKMTGFVTSFEKDSLLRAVRFTLETPMKNTETMRVAKYFIENISDGYAKKLEDCAKHNASEDIGSSRRQVTLRSRNGEIVVHDKHGIMDRAAVFGCCR